MNSNCVAHDDIFNSSVVNQLRDDLALALRAAAMYGLGEGICNHFSVAVPGQSDKFLLNPRGLMWQEVRSEDIILIDTEGNKLSGRHEPEPSAMFIHAAIHRITGKNVVLHTHMPFASALALTKNAGIDTLLSQNAMRFHGRVACDRNFNGLAQDHTEGERIANAMQGAEIAFLGNHGVVVCGDRLDYAFDDLYYLERACQLEVFARSTGLPLNSIQPNMALQVAEQSQQERLQSQLFFTALRRVLK